jgi:hypothetical protein
MRLDRNKLPLWLGESPTRNNRFMEKQLEQISDQVNHINALIDKYIINGMSRTESAILCKELRVAHAQAVALESLFRGIEPPRIGDD